MRTTRYVQIAAMAAMMVGITACGGGSKGPTETSTSGLTTVVCDESFRNVLQEEIDVFEYVYPDANIMPYYVDEKAAVDSLLDFKTRTIIISRELNEKELSYFKSKNANPRQSKIAVDAVALIVNPENEVSALSQLDVKEILSGKYTKWSDIEPSKLGDITVVFDNQSSSIVRYMREKVLGGGNFGPNVHAQGTTSAVFDAVAKNKNAIGIIGVSWISSDLKTRELPIEEKVAVMNESNNVELGSVFDDKVKVLKIDGADQQAVSPSQQNIYTGDYPYTRPIYMIFTGVNSTLGHGFYSFVTSDQGKKIVLSMGIMPDFYNPRQPVELVP